MSYRIDLLETIASCARIAREIGGLNTEAAIDYATAHVSEDCARIIAGDRPSMTTEQVDEYRWLNGVTRDVRNGFVSPTIGNVRDYVRSMI